jgi:hypothetical protein
MKQERFSTQRELGSGDLMIKHVVCFRFKDDVPEDVKENLLSEYHEFPTRFPKMRNFSIGNNISARDQTFQYAFVVDFETETDLKEYLSSKEHEDHVVNRFRPVISARAIVSYEV